MSKRAVWFPKNLDDEIKQIYVPSKTSVPEAQLLKVKKIEDESCHFHSLDKGCELEERRIGYRGALGKKSNLTIQFCKTHQCKVHKDGWEIGWWGGSKSKL